MRLIRCLALLSAAILVSAAAPTSFCKCTCFSNYTIIALDAVPDSSLRLRSSIPFAISFNSREEVLQSPDDSEEDESDSDEPLDLPSGEDAPKEYRAGNCNDCNRKFCLDYNLPICKGAEEKDVFTTCFQRDSRKDQAVVLLFILATSGLLGWALLSPFVERFRGKLWSGKNYIPVAENGRTVGG